MWRLHKNKLQDRDGLAAQFTLSCSPLTVHKVPLLPAFAKPLGQGTDVLAPDGFSASEARDFSQQCRHEHWQFPAI
jgi:hypothetical protein